MEKEFKKIIRDNISKSFIETHEDYDMNGYRVIIKYCVFVVMQSYSCFKTYYVMRVNGIVITDDCSDIYKLIEKEYEKRQEIKREKVKLQEQKKLLDIIKEFKGE